MGIYRVSHHITRFYMFNWNWWYLMDEKVVVLNYSIFNDWPERFFLLIGRFTNFEKKKTNICRALYSVKQPLKFCWFYHKNILERPLHVWYLNYTKKAKIYSNVHEMGLIPKISLYLFLTGLHIPKVYSLLGGGFPYPEQMLRGY